MLTTHNFSGNRQFSADGRFLLYQECTTPGGSARVSVYLDGQPIGKLFPGDWIELDHVASRWEVFPDSPTCSGVVVIGNGSLRSLRTMGTIETAERSATSSAGGSHFTAGVSRTAAAGLFACIGLVNGASSRIAVRTMLVSSAGNVGASEVARFYRAVGGASVPLSTRFAMNKQGGGGASDAAIQTFDSATAAPPTIAGVSVFNLWDEASILSSEAYDGIRSAPLILLPTESVWICAATAATFKQALFEFERLPS